MHPLTILQGLTLVAIANTMPLLATKLCGAHFAWPLDGGSAFIDGRPVFGRSKTMRGVAISLLGTAAAAPIIGMEAKMGALLAAAAMSGDLLSSFAKRRLNLPSGTRATGLDQVPESLLPLLLLSRTQDLTLVDVGVATAIFFIGEILLARLFYKLHLRDQPY